MNKSVKSDVPESGISRLLFTLSLKDTVVIFLFLLLWSYSILLYYRWGPNSFLRKIIMSTNRAWNRIINFSGDQMIREEKHGGLWYRWALITWIVSIWLLSQPKLISNLNLILTSTTYFQNYLAHGGGQSTPPAPKIHSPRQKNAANRNRQHARKQALLLLG